ncbi:ubiquinol-cytochrome c reductase iron-sulfur subunit [Pseudonocardia halophobica]|uniref:Cytochrome bc1 complex Rieske iron-sulfur subunit n=1 Tax=Pseudonocardia halophobica TaxID=29401 RepID=A0A9W6L1N3_9PSEU|nr:Rieske 2Fe-2S domain-containing protein [Pseudonocardia halophobica]GLL09399.1 ubiquinol-cytochrome c reductase iron-sulfur subunit [Pseudonocardia halophobica]
MSTPREPTGPELERLSRSELVDLGHTLDGIRIVTDEPPPGSSDPRRERRNRRRVTLLLVLSLLAAGAFVGAYLFWPTGYVPPGAPGHTAHLLYTPLLGITFFGAVGALGAAMIVYVRSFYPDEVAVQHLEKGPSAERDRFTAAATFAEAGAHTGFGRRALIRRLGLTGLGVVGILGGLVAIGGLVRNPWKEGGDAPLWTTGWKPVGGETVFLRETTGDPTEIVKIRPEDVDPDGMVTVVPFRESERGDVEALHAAEMAPDNPVMLIRLPPGTRVDHLPRREDLHYGDYYAFSKVCTHLGCPASLYDTRLQVFLCPCHQSQFKITEGARPIFGPAARPLPQLPITVDADGFLVARGDFPDPVGPSFWEIGRGSH